MLQEKLESWYRDYEVGRGRPRGWGGACGDPRLPGARTEGGPPHPTPRAPRGREAAGSGAVAAVPGPCGGFRGDGGTRSGGGPHPRPGGSAGALSPVQPKRAAGPGEQVAAAAWGSVWDVDPHRRPVITILTPGACSARSCSRFLFCL